MENMQVTRRQHFLPVMYLKNFTDENGSLWKRDLKYGTYKQATPAQTGYREFLYETRWKNPSNMEKQFALLNYLENHFSSRENIYSQCIASVCQKICLDNSDISSITADERMILAEFTTNIFLRHPNMMGQMELDKVSQEEMNNYHANELIALFGSEAETAMLFLKKCEWLDSQFSGGYFQTVQREFENMCLTFLVSSGAEFISCDWPIIYAHIDGKIICFLLPLTPKCCVSYNVFLKKENVDFISDDMVRLYNKLHIEKKSSRMNYLYAHRKEDIEVLFEKGDE